MSVLPHKNRTTVPPRGLSDFSRDLIESRPEFTGDEYQRVLMCCFVTDL